MLMLLPTDVNKVGAVRADLRSVDITEFDYIINSKNQAEGYFQVDMTCRMTLSEKKITVDLLWRGRAWGTWSLDLMKR